MKKRQWDVSSAINKTNIDIAQCKKDAGVYKKKALELCKSSKN
jgi:hypothetical protein